MTCNNKAAANYCRISIYLKQKGEEDVWSFDMWITWQRGHGTRLGDNSK